MKAEEPNVDQLFQQSVRYIVPSYQRNYTWGADDQWLPLWEDIVGVAERVLNEEAVGPHFMGAIITKFVGQASYIYEYIVVDGQQRLTTMALAMEAMRSVLSRRGHDQPASQLEALVVNPERDRKTDQDKLKIRPKGRDYGLYDALMMASLEGAALPEQSRLVECYRFFEKRCDAWIGGISSALESERAEALVGTIRSRLQFADIRLEESENEHGIFEALNARGKRLTEWEKTKSYILSLAAGEGDAGSGVYERFFRRFDEDEYWDQHVGVARFSGPQMDWFLYNWIQVDVGRRVATEKVYREFRKRGQETLRDDQEEYERKLTELSHGASRFRELVGRVDARGNRVELDGQSARMVDRVFRLGLTSLLPPLLAIYLKDGTRADWAEAVEAFESYIMRRLAVNARFASVDDASQRVLERVVAVETRRDAVGELIACLEAEVGGNRWPSDEEVKEKVVGDPLYGRAAQYRVRWVLEAMAPHYTPPEAGVLFSPRQNLHIEHVIPQDFEDYWSEVLASDEDALEFIHSLGNLTLVTQRMNTRLGNRDWNHKREWLSRDTIAMNQAIARAVPSGEQWSKEHVRRRGLELAEIMIGLWPHAEELRGRLGLA